MNVKTIAVTYGRKVNLGNYESLNIEVSAWADLHTDPIVDRTTGEVLEPADSVSESYKALFLEVRTQVKEYILRAKGIKPVAEEPSVPQDVNAEG